MMPNFRSKKRDIDALIALNLDNFFSGHGFRRTRASKPIYERQTGESLQSIDVTAEMRPSDSPSSVAAVYPWLSVSIPDIDEQLRKMIKGDNGLLPGVTGGALRQPIEFTSANEESARWYVDSIEDLSRVSGDVASFVSRWTLPFLATYTSARDILEADLRGDQRVLRDRAQMLRVVAAACVEIGPVGAKELAHKFFAAPGLRKRYQVIFDYLDRHSGH